MDNDDHEASSSSSKVLLTKKESMGSTERQISVDPISVKGGGGNYVYPTSPTIDLLIPHPSRTYFDTQSLPNSASSSPPFPYKKRINKHQSQPSSLSAIYRSDSIALANIESLHEINLLKSKSCGEGRASGPPEEFDICFSNVKPQDNNTKNYYNVESNNKMDIIGDIDNNKGKGKGKDKGKSNEDENIMDEKFKCNALCLYLPGFNKGVKPVKARRQVSYMSQSKESEATSDGHVVSKRVSLEKFECVSWTSSGRIMNDNDYEGDSSNLFFDLPLELIKCGINDDTDSPVTTAFVFDKEPKPVLKKTISKSTSIKSSESLRRVRFSTSSSTSYPDDSTSSCIKPGVRKSREDFNAFFKAQSALNV